MRDPGVDPLCVCLASTPSAPVACNTILATGVEFTDEPTNDNFGPGSRILFFPRQTRAEQMPAEVERDSLATYQLSGGATQDITDCGEALTRIGILAFQHNRTGVELC
ncbi:hypothetical protein IF1G_06317 [Cordyceps javanica]|uniref:Uncharacterized protein n=1 Tax=Cordyceps javanica TaxID=43265 RepID=A0A545V0T7_9HYPO|nr:hypothetical protein IF1G_06317 [Cordyceps javanica]